MLYCFAFAAALDIADTPSAAVIKIPIAVTYLKPYSTGQIDIAIVTIRNIKRVLRSFWCLLPIMIVIIVRIADTAVSPAVISGEK